MPVFESSYAVDETPDLAINLAVGTKIVTTELAAELLSTETDLMLVTDAGLSDPSGTIGIENEIIYYYRYHRDEPGTICSLQRGQEGTTPATHAVATPIIILGRSRYSNPAFTDSVVAMQAKLVELEGAAGAGFSFTEVEVTLGSVPRRSGKFNITGAGLTIGKHVLMQQNNGPYTGKGTRTDEAEMDRLTVAGKVTSATNIECFWGSPTAVKGNFKFGYAVSG